jgi:outer membrane lipoprotein-sorting protein
LRVVSRLAAILVALTLAAGLAAPLAAASLSPDDQALVNQASAYLDGINAVRGRFEQTDARGQVSGGVLYLKRPGLARFAYDPPSSLLVVSDGRTVTVTNPRLKTTNRYPLGLTPLSVLLSGHVRLDRGVAISRVTRLDAGFAIAAYQAGHRAQGQVIMTFGDNPLRLTAWTMIDAQGQTTEVRVTELKAVPGLDPGLFTPPSYYDRRESAPR